MTDAPQQPAPAEPVTRQWRVTLAGDHPPQTITAHGFRVEHGALVLVLPRGCVAAYAPGTWLTIEQANLDGLDDRL
jgi:hypothetical protein